MDLRKALHAALRGETLSRADAGAAVADALIDPNPALLAGLLVALAGRGETAAEIAGTADALRAGAEPFEHPFDDAIDTCGTGGDGAGTFNISTAAAIVAAAAGARVIKHGNRAVSSQCGSADLLEACGAAVDTDPAVARAALERCGFTFLFAPRYHPALRAASTVRRTLGVPTVFNLAAPLCNPARVRRQVLGVADSRRAADLRGALAALGHERAYVVHGAGGLDELALAPGNRALPVGPVPEASFVPEDLGLSSAPTAALAGGDAGHSARILHAVLDGERGAPRDAVLLNAGAALLVAGRASDPGEAVARAGAAVDSGRARTVLRDYVETTARLTDGSAA